MHWPWHIPSAAARDANAAADLLGLPHRLRPEEIDADEGYVAPGYGIPSPAGQEALHLLARMREDLRNGATLEQAIGLAIEHSGRAVVVASVVLSGGLAVNLLSSFPPLQLLGALGAFVMLVAVACDLVLLPALLVALRAGRALRGRT